MAKNKLLVINPDSTYEIDPTWAAAKDALGGAMIEVVYLSGGAVLLVDEEGLLKGLQLNPVASAWALHEIVGPAVCVPPELVNAVLN